jgi:hypothetical protein
VVLASSTLAERLWGFFVPAPEGSIEGCRLRITKQVRDRADRERRIRQIALGGILPYQFE